MKNGIAVPNTIVVVMTMNNTDDWMILIWLISIPFIGEADIVSISANATLPLTIPAKQHIANSLVVNFHYSLP